ncbi:hypothetical protein DFH06DRAFT_1298113 [Mycena polygramma]|nr:hypothetical protein DFH06DRAFT_1298113 [Mycena polygramma]
MHPELLPSKLLGLPDSCRGVACLAADSSANANVVLDAVIELHAVLRREANPVASAAKLLPVVYANLDLQRIPDPDLLTDSTVHPRVLAAVYAMEFIHFCSFRLTSAVTRELWPRLWAWAQFIDNHESFHAQTNFFRTQILSHIALLMMPTTVQLIHTTPDVCFFAARALAGLVTLCEQDETEIRKACHRTAILGVKQFLAACYDFPEHLKELVGGVGGDVDDFVLLLVRYIAVLVRGLGHNPDEVVRDMLLLPFVDIHDFLCTTYIPATREEPALLWTRLASMGYVTIATQGLAKLAEAGTTPVVQEAVAVSLLQIHMIISDSSTAQIVEALKAGILRALVLCSARFGSHTFIPDSISSLMGTLLLGSTLVYQSMVAFPAALVDALEAERTPGFATSQCRREWQLLKTTVTNRLEFLDGYSSFVAKKACDNYECDRLMEEKTAFRRCSGCRVNLYCSRECQKISWRTFAHRTKCAKIQEHPEPHTWRLTKQTNRFHEYMILREYQTQKFSIFLQKLAHIHRYGDTNFCVVMESINGGLCTAKVAPRAEWDRAAFSNGYPYFLEDEQGEGRAQMHLVRSIGRSRTVESPWLLRSSPSVVTANLIRIAAQIPPGVDVGGLEESHPSLSEEVRSLVSLQVQERYLQLVQC